MPSRTVTQGSRRITGISGGNVVPWTNGRGTIARVPHGGLNNGTEFKWAYGVVSREQNPLCLAAKRDLRLRG